MSIRRGIAVVAALTAITFTAACTSDGSDPDPSPSTATAPPITPSTGTTSEAPGVQDVPLAGDDHVKIEWTLDKGVNGSDPVVDVGRRTLAVVYLAAFSPTWRSDDAIRKVSTSLTTGDDVLLEPTRSARTTKPVAAEGPVLITVQPPEVKGDTAVVWACLDARAAFDDAPLHKTNLGTLASVSLTATKGVWKATAYDLKPQDPTSDERYYQRCQQDE